MCSATGSRAHAASVCAAVTCATSVSKTADFLCANSSLCQVVTTMIDAFACGDGAVNQPGSWAASPQRLRGSL